MTTYEIEWEWTVRLECGHTFGSRGGTEQKDYVREHKEFICPQCDLPQDVKFFSARGL